MKEKNKHWILNEQFLLQYKACNYKCKKYRAHQLDLFYEWESRNTQSVWSHK